MSSSSSVSSSIAAPSQLAVQSDVHSSAVQILPQSPNHSPLDQQVRQVSSSSLSLIPAGSSLPLQGRQLSFPIGDHPSALVPPSLLPAAFSQLCSSNIGQPGGVYASAAQVPSQSEDELLFPPGIVSTESSSVDLQLSSLPISAAAPSIVAIPALLQSAPRIIGSSSSNEIGPSAPKQISPSASIVLPYAEPFPSSAVSQHPKTLPRVHASIPAPYWSALDLAAGLLAYPKSPSVDPPHSPSSGIHPDNASNQSYLSPADIAFAMRGISDNKAAAPPPKQRRIKKVKNDPLMDYFVALVPHCSSFQKLDYWLRVVFRPLAAPQTQKLERFMTLAPHCSSFEELRNHFHPPLTNLEILKFQQMYDRLKEGPNAAASNSNNPEIQMLEHFMISAPHCSSFEELLNMLQVRYNRPLGKSEVQKVTQWYSTFQKWPSVADSHSQAISSSILESSVASSVPPSPRSATHSAPPMPPEDVDDPKDSKEATASNQNNPLIIHVDIVTHSPSPAAASKAGSSAHDGSKPWQRHVQVRKENAQMKNAQMKKAYAAQRKLKK